MKSIFMALCLAAVGSVAHASGLSNDSIIELVNQNLQKRVMMTALTHEGIVFGVGDVDHYSLDIGSFIQGTMDMSVREETTEGYWLVEDMNLMGQAQKVEVLISKTNGQILKMIVNGKEQTPPTNNVSVTTMKQDKVTVPAGTFDVVYIKAHDNDANNDLEEWVNPKLIPIMGMAKSISPTQMGAATMELTSFKKN